MHTVIRSHLGSMRRWVGEGLRSTFVTVNPRPLFVFGNQKSGTSAIAVLLAELTGLSVTNDLQKEVYRTTYDKVVKGHTSLQQFIRRHKIEFSKDIIKEPVLTLLCNELFEAFPASRSIFVIRDPRDNIRSILNRLRIRGDLEDMDDAMWDSLSPAWRLNLDSRWLGLDGGTYIDMMAARWNRLSDIYLSNSSRFALVPYETFMANKLGTLIEVAETLGLEAKNDVQSRLDVQFQPAGDRSVKWLDFFGPENLSKIERACRERMVHFGYTASH